MIDSANQLSIRRQCELFLINRSSLYKQKKLDLDSKELCQKIRDIYELKPVYGYRRITKKLKRNNIIFTIFSGSVASVEHNKHL